ncbi:MAG: hypothetical protein Q8O61_03145 [Nocardioides sp.]|nr:hypothetical protein [Nocardioides sp.]
MNRSDRVRRAVSLTLAVLCFLVVPQLAFGQFSSSKAPAMSVGTVKLVTPTAVTGTYNCRSLWIVERADVSVTGFHAADQPAGVSYVYSFKRVGSSQTDTTTTSAKQASLTSGWHGADAGDTSYTLTVVAKLGEWTAEEYSRTFTCRWGQPGVSSF